MDSDTLLRAIGSGNKNKITSILENFSKDRIVNIRDKYGRSIFHYVCEKGFPETAQLLTEKLCDTARNFFIPDKYGDTPFMKAANRDFHDIVEMILTKRPSIKQVMMQNEQGLNALMIAIRNQNCEMIAAEILQLDLRNEDLAIQSRDGKHALLWACRQKNEKIIELILALKPASGLVTMQDESKKNALIWAAIQCSVKILIQMLLLGVPRDQIDLGDDMGRTCLLHALQAKRDAEIIELLVKKGNPAIQDNDGRNAVHYGINSGNMKNTLIVLNEADLNATFARDVFGRTPLMLAVIKEQLRVVKAIMSKSPTEDKVFMKDAEGRTALIYAAKSGNLPIVKAICKISANEKYFSIRDKTLQKTAVELAEMYEYTDIVNFLEMTLTATFFD